MLIDARTLTLQRSTKQMEPITPNTIVFSSAQDVIVTDCVSFQIQNNIWLAGGLLCKRKRKQTTTFHHFH